MAKYGRKAQQKVEKAMHERKRGTLKSGRSGKRVTSRKQAIAIGLSEARREGGKVPTKERRRPIERQSQERVPFILPLMRMAPPDAPATASSERREASEVSRRAARR